ncbi:MAG: hypothetical protein E6K24_14290 [Gammaproteobacteria bacterium]|nr:MAG: hypothetical protein E6K24_14290 [Gammaproteobacteria bacterium]
MGWPGESATGAFAQSDQYNSARMTNRRLAILGAGNMGRALIGGLLRSGTRPEHLSVGEPRARPWRGTWASRPAPTTPRRFAAPPWWCSR